MSDLGKTQPEAGAEAPSTDLQRRGLLRMVAASAGLAAVGGTVLTACGGGGDDATTADGRMQPLAAKPPITTPTITCVPNGTDGATAIDVTVCAPAGGTGLPAGFSIQWMTCAEYAQHDVTNPDGTTTTTVYNTWFASDDPRLCKASFSGNASGTNYNLAAGACLTVHPGSFTIDNPQGYSSTCETPLVCGTCYVFLAFGHATSKLSRSANSGLCTSTTNACLPAGFVGCTKSHGYFKNYALHAAEIDCAFANLGTTTINGVTFISGTQAAAYLAQTGQGSPSTLQKQLLALGLNIAVSGNCANACNAGNVYPAGFGAAKLCGIADGVTILTGVQSFPAGSAALLNGQTVQQVFTAINGGGNYGLSAGDVTALLDLLNLSFDGLDGTCCGASTFGQGHLCT
ncbi:MAG: hypothetical protein JF606_17320 [Burkholderiales bacterium]|nr:hypothetical protein [Burkholderiales bacterium]